MYWFPVTLWLSVVPSGDLHSCWRKKREQSKQAVESTGCCHKLTSRTHILWASCYCSSSTTPLPTTTSPYTPPNAHRMSHTSTSKTHSPWATCCCTSSTTLQPTRESSVTYQDSVQHGTERAIWAPRSSKNPKLTAPTTACCPPCLPSQPCALHTLWHALPP